MEKRLVLALIFSILILVMWSIMVPQPKKEPLEEAPLPPAKKTPLFASEKQEAPKSPLFGSEKQEVPKLQPIVPQEIRVGGQGEEIVSDLPLYRAIFSTQGGVLTSFQLREYPEKHVREQKIDRAIASSRNEDMKKSLELLKEKLPETQGVEMVSLSSSLKGVFPLSLFWQEEGLDLNYGIYQIDKRANNLIFSFTTRDDLKVIKKYTLRKDSYLIDVEIRLENQGKKTFSASPLLIKYGPDLGFPAELSGRADSYHRCLVLVKEAGGEKIVRETFRRGRKGEVLTKNYPEAVWGGLENKYFLAAFLPPIEPHSILLEKDASGGLYARLKMQMPELIPGGILSRRFSLYLGPKQQEAVKAVGGGLEKSIDYGMLATSLRIMDILRFFYRLTRNWGVAIIMLTILTKIVLLPLTQKSMRSMEKMQRLQPRMKELRLKYKDDPKKQQKELMELYRQQGVNPMGGCFPMMLQMPIFIALFTTLRNTIDLRGAGFLWIKDLSLPDTVCYISGLPLNPLPLVMGVSMFWQQKMTTADPEQAKMMMFMPIFFTFMFYNFSSGLVLYWFIQNILTMGHQYGMRIRARKHEKA